MGKPKRRGNRAGHLRQLPSGRWQAKFPGPDGITYPAPATFDTRLDADAWLKRQGLEVELGTWVPPRSSATSATSATRMPTLDDYATGWLATRTLKPRTRQEYEGLLQRHILPQLGSARLDRITPDTVRVWHADCCPDKPRTRALSYSLLKTILATAVDDELLDRSPCRIRGAGTSKRQTATDILESPAQVDDLAAAMPEHLAATVVLGCWTALRLGEVLGLQRRDIDLDAGTVTVRQTAVQLPGGPKIGTPKSDAGARTVAVPPHALPMLQRHLDNYTGPTPTALLFPSVKDPAVPLGTSTFYNYWYPARASIGREDLRFHDLRHSGATWVAQSGATLAELMARIGHTSPGVAMRYQHAASERDAALAESLSEMADKVVPLKKKPRHAG